MDVNWESFDSKQSQGQFYFLLLFPSIYLKDSIKNVSHNQKDVHVSTRCFQNIISYIAKIRPSCLTWIA